MEELPTMPPTGIEAVTPTNRDPQDQDTNHDEPPPKRAKASENTDTYKKGVAPIRHEYLLHASNRAATPLGPEQDDQAEAGTYQKSNPTTARSRGQNTHRPRGSPRDAVEICQSRALCDEFTPQDCRFKETCKFEHDIRRYLLGKRPDLETFNKQCPVFAARGVCSGGWRCRFVGSHMQEREHEDGRKELVLIRNQDSSDEALVNSIPNQVKMDLSRRRIQTPKSDIYVKWLEGKGNSDGSAKSAAKDPTEVLNGASETSGQDGSVPANADDEIDHENRAQYHEAPLLPSEKRRLYFGPDTPVLAPLTTQGNIAFRRLCVDLGAQMTYSEMAMSLPLIQGSKPEWALLKAHPSEAEPPRINEGSSVPDGYEHARDLRFGAQIAASKPWQALKATEIITRLCPSLRVIDLNCGCPIDLVYRIGAGSALLDNPSRLEKILRGMNLVSGEVPISFKLRMGTKDHKPTAMKICERLILGGYDADGQRNVPSGVAAITLHGRSRQQRYTKDADWTYIAECSALIKSITTQQDQLADTIRETDPRDGPATPSSKVFFLGNGDCYSHVEYFDHIQKAGVDSVMLARGPLVKPWLFEEIEKGQYLDKTARERLDYIERFARYGLEAWGADEVGLGTTRRFLLDWLSFTHRYVPIGLLEYLPPRLQDRPPRYQGRDELETLLASGDYRDWIKIRYTNWFCLQRRPSINATTRPPTNGGPYKTPNLDSTHSPPPLLHYSPVVSEPGRADSVENTPISTPIAPGARKRSEKDRESGGRPLPQRKSAERGGALGDLRPQSPWLDSELEDFSYPLFIRSSSAAPSELEPVPLDLTRTDRGASTSPGLYNRMSNLTSALQTSEAMGLREENDVATSVVMDAMANGGREGGGGAGRHESFGAGAGARPISMKSGNRERPRRESQAGSMMSWGGVSVGSWIRDDIIMAGTSPFSHHTPSYHSSSYLPKLEANFMRDFACCGITLPSLHDLLGHYEEFHGQQREALPRPVQSVPQQSGPPPSNNSTNKAGIASGGAGGMQQQQQQQQTQFGGQLGQAVNFGTTSMSGGTSSTYGSTRDQWRGRNRGFSKTALQPVQDIDVVGDMEMDDDMAMDVDDRSTTPQLSQASMVPVSSAGGLYMQSRNTLRPQLAPLDLVGATFAQTSPAHQGLRNSQPTTPSSAQPVRPLQNNPTVSSVNTPTLSTQTSSQRTFYQSVFANEDALDRTSSGRATPVATTSTNSSFCPPDPYHNFGGANSGLDMSDLCIDEPAKRLFSSEGGGYFNPTTPGRRDSTKRVKASTGAEGEDHKPFKCPVVGCEKAYKNQNGLKYHKTHGHSNHQLVENTDGTYSIMNPETSTPYPSTLGMEKEKPYGCDRCGKRYKNLNGLKYHKGHSPACNSGGKTGGGGGDVSRTGSVSVAAAGGSRSGATTPTIIAAKPELTPTGTNSGRNTPIAPHPPIQQQIQQIQIQPQILPFQSPQLQQQQQQQIPQQVQQVQQQQHMTILPHPPPS
ncbi:MAG: hypothetical protein M1823_004820 [Watsoniomyces obsoletus]|nr:MAG: hypothetical protein M1823_004820 [Watsoniomyces obsoletus]